MKAVFRDKLYILESFSDEFLVRCPQCDKCAVVVLNRAVETDKPLYVLPFNFANPFAPRRLVCSNCGYTKDWAGNTVRRAGATDWFFHLPLWLQIPCCSQILWAYNQAHLAYLESFVQAEIRESPPGSLASKLPGWMKSAKNRDEILRSIAKLKTI